MGDYVDETQVEAVVSLTISTSSVPTTAQVAQWISEVEAWVTEKKLGSHTATDVYLDVPTAESGEGVYNWHYFISQERLVFDEGLGYVIPLTNINRPLLSITSLAKNDESYSDAASWDTLTEGPADGSSFVLLQTGDKQHGYGLYFYDNAPLVGPKRLKMTYSFGHNIDGDILTEYCTLVVAVKVLEARMGTSNIDGLSYIDGGDFGIALNTRYRERIESWRTRIQEIKDDFFPQEAQKGGVTYAIL